MSRNDDYRTRNLLEYLYHRRHDKLIGIDLSRQTNINIPQQINFTGKLGKDGATIFFVSVKQQKTVLNFY